MGVTRIVGRVAAAAGLAASVGFVAVPAAGAASPGSAGPANPLPYFCRLKGLSPCWAFVQHPPVVYYGHSGGGYVLDNDSSVQISCWYYGTPVIGGDNVEDHVVELDDNSGFHTLNGHVPDYNINLHDHNPWQDGIPRC